MSSSARIHELAVPTVDITGPRWGAFTPARRPQGCGRFHWHSAHWWAPACGGMLDYISGTTWSGVPRGLEGPPAWGLNPHTRRRIIPATLPGMCGWFDPSKRASRELAVPYGKKESPPLPLGNEGPYHMERLGECIRWVRRRRSRSQDRGRRRLAPRRAGRWVGPSRCRRP